jgi:hypothetical protein
MRRASVCRLVETLPSVRTFLSISLTAYLGIHYRSGTVRSILFEREKPIGSSLNIIQHEIGKYRFSPMIGSTLAWRRQHAPCPAVAIAIV